MVLVLVQVTSVDEILPEQPTSIVNSARSYNLSPRITSQFELAEGILIVEGCKLSVEFFFCPNGGLGHDIDDMHEADLVKLTFSFQQLVVVEYIKL